MNTPTITTKVVRASINERKLFENLGLIFKTSFSFVGELMQNARRAGATFVDFKADHATRQLEVFDDGCGIEDFQNLIELATSGWDDGRLVLTEKPFGMGLFALFYACECVTIRSRGQMITITLEDIVSKRELHVIHDSEPVLKGTRILLTGLKDKLMEEVQYAHHQYGQYAKGNEVKWAMYVAITSTAQGFDIPVVLNGVDVPQPYARRHIDGQATSIGFVSLCGIHTKNTNHISLARNETRYFLQGLPIELSCYYSHFTNVVHLDSERFIAVMPDRANLQDAGKQLALVDTVVKSILEQHLLAQKAALPATLFIANYFDLACKSGFAALFNDMPYLPGSIINSVASVEQRSDEIWTGASFKAEHMVSREDLMDNTKLVWRDAPYSTTDDPWSATLLKIMQRMQVDSVKTNMLDAKHWVFDLLPSMLDFNVTCTPHGAKASIGVDVAWDACTLTLVDAVDVVITSTAHPGFRIEHKVVQDWLVVPAKSEEEGDDDFTGQTICYFTEHDASPDHPANVFSSFNDEHDHFMQDWQDDEQSKWNSLMNGLLGVSLSTTIKTALQETSVKPTPSQHEHLTLVRLTRTWNSYREAPSEPKFDTIDLQGSEFWTAFAINLALEGQNVSDIADRLSSAFRTTAQPNLLEIPDGAKKMLAEGAGYQFKGVGTDEQCYALLPGENAADFEAMDHNYMGFFTTREEAIKEVHDDVVRDTCRFHGLNEEQWTALAFPEQYAHVRKAHEQRILDAISRREAKIPTQSE